MKGLKASDNQRKSIARQKQKSSSQNESPDDVVQIVEKITKINGEQCIRIYERKQMLGKGGFANCYVSQQIGTKRKAATKVISKVLLESFRTKLRLNNQIKLHKSLRHQNIVQFYHFFEDEQNVYILLELCQKGCLNELLRIRYELTTPEIQSLVLGMCQGLKYLHSRGIIHRDMKLGNVFLDSNYKVKIGDFGLAAKLQFNKQNKRTVCGTPNYIAPQVLSGRGYYFQVDVWAIGIIIYTLYFTIPPFQTQSATQTYQKIRQCNYVFPKYHKAPEEALSLIKKILVPNPANRLTLDEILDSPFMKLGSGIPLELPLIIDKRPPTKKDFINIPLLKSEDKQSSLKLIIDKKSVRQKQKKQSRVDDLKQKEIERVRKIEEFQENIFIYIIGKNKLGIIDQDTKTIYQLRRNSNNQQKEQICKIVIQNNEEHRQTLQTNNFLYKTRFSFWKKQLSSSSSQQQNAYIKKVHKYKNMLLLRLSNGLIQVIFKEGDGFIYHHKTNMLSYFKQTTASTPNIPIDPSLILHENKENIKSIQNLQQILKFQNQTIFFKKLSYIKGVIEQTLSRVQKKTNSH